MSSTRTRVARSPTPRRAEPPPGLSPLSRNVPPGWPETVCCGHPRPRCGAGGAPAGGGGRAAVTPPPSAVVVRPDGLLHLESADPHNIVRL
ncbi:hypothetical protein ACFW2I_28110, partial [Streptomyces nigra]